MKFTEAVKQYSEEKKARGLSPVVNAKEIDKIRQLYKEGKFNENAEPEKTDANADANAKEEPKMNEAQKAEFEKTLKEFRDYKESKGMGRGVSAKQKKMIERTILCGTMTEPTVIKETKDEKTIIAGPSTKIEEGKENPETSTEPKKLDENTKNEIRSKILEARKNIFVAKTKLNENDMMGAADATQGAMDAVNAADAAIADPAAQGAVPQNIVDTVASLQTTVNDLATQCGIQPPVDVGADPNAGVPAVDGATPDPNAQAGAAPVMEGLETTKARLAKREALLKAIKEGAAAPSNGQDAMVQEINSMTNPQEFHNIDKNNSEELVKPTTKKSPEAANTWPTVKGTYKESVTEKMISDRIAENEDRWDFNRVLREGILG